MTTSTLPSLAHLSNPLVTPTQLTSISPELQKFALRTGLLTQASGILAGVPQGVISHAIVLGLRYLLAREEDARTWSNDDDKEKHELSESELSRTSLYLASKLSATPLSPRTVLLLSAHLTRHPPSPVFSHAAVTAMAGDRDDDAILLSESVYQLQKMKLFAHEKLVLRAIGFETQFTNPSLLALTYLTALLNPDKEAERKVAARVVQLLNGALLSPQLLYVTHTPNVLACAAIYLAAREVGVKLPATSVENDEEDDGEAEEESGWWLIFDVSREELGFVVLGMKSLGLWVEEVVREQQQQQHEEKRTDVAVTTVEDA